MNIVLWILQVFLVSVFAWHGWLYMTWSASADAWHEKQHPGKPLGLPPAFRTFIGICELLAAVRLILPGITGILPWLTPPGCSWIDHCHAWIGRVSSVSS